MFKAVGRGSNTLTKRKGKKKEEKALIEAASGPNLLPEFQDKICLSLVLRNPPPQPLLLITCLNQCLYLIQFVKNKPNSQFIPDRSG